MLNDTQRISKELKYDDKFEEKSRGEEANEQGNDQSVINLDAKQSRRRKMKVKRLMDPTSIL